MPATSVDWKKVRQELKAKRSAIFDQFVKNPGKVSLAIEIKMLDDEMLECAEHAHQERDRQK